MVRLLVILLVVLMSLPVDAEEPAAADSISPFGLRMGTGLSELQKVASVKPTAGQPGQFEIDRPPQPHPAFSMYRLIVGPKSGLCRVAAASDSLSREDATAVFRRVHRTLESKYGTHPPLNEDRLVSSWQSWADPRAPKGISAIMLVLAYPDDKTKAAGHMVMLFYVFENHDACIKEIGKAERDAL